MTALSRALRSRIARDGPISVGDYMHACLHDPEHGYYRVRDVLGRDGDFVTAPEISQVFGELIGLWAAATWQSMGRPAAFDLVELGPGRGTLMRDAIRALRVAPDALAAARIVLVEASPHLRARQDEIFAGHATQPRWCEIPAFAAGTAPAIVIANEFLDTFPVDQAVWTATGWQRRAVATDGDALGFITLPFSTGQSTGIAEGLNPSLGAIFERQDWGELIGALAARAAQAPIAALFIDYGHTSQACGETLQAVRRHRYEGLLEHPGEADLSCHVDFTAFARACAAAGAGLVVDDPITQAEFLGRLGAVERTRRLMAANPGKAGTIEQGVARLLAANGMGDRFKAIGVRRHDVPRLPAF